MKEKAKIFFENLKTKSDKTKKWVALSTAFVISGTIFVIWLSVILPDWNNARIHEANVDAKISEPSPLKTMSNTIDTATAEVGNQVGQIKSAVSDMMQNSNSTASQATSSVITASATSSPTTTTSH